MNGQLTLAKSARHTRVCVAAGRGTVCVRVCLSVCECVYVYVYVYVCACVYVWAADAPHLSTHMPFTCEQQKRQQRRTCDPVPAHTQACIVIHCVPLCVSVLTAPLRRSCVPTYMQLLVHDVALQ